MIAPPFHEGNRRVEIILERDGPPNPAPPTDDLFATRVKRAAALIAAGRQVQPDSKGSRTKRAFCLLTKVAAALAAGTKINDRFVDGWNSNAIVNGKRALDEWGMPTPLCGYPANWDPPEVTGADLDKFFFSMLPILKGPGWAPDGSDDQILSVLGEVVLRIDEGINRTDEYIAKNGNPAVGGYAGDKTRPKLQKEYVTRMDDPNDIYSCFKTKIIF
jgi:hypothetical protein